MTAPPLHLLSKSTFMRGCQCHKSLWLHKHQPDLRDEMDAQQASIFATGTNIGELARDLFPGGVDASPATPYEFQQSVADTAAYIAAGHEVIYEAAFQYEGVLCAIDILVKSRGAWYAYEVKSSTSVKQPFIQDAALQYHVITKSGIALRDIYLVHVNNKYKRKGDLDINGLFTRNSLKKEVLPLQPFITQKISELKKICALTTAPDVALGKHCNKPYRSTFSSIAGRTWRRR